MQSTKCVVLSPQMLDQFISLPLGFLTPKSGLCILNVLVGFFPFVESFILEEF